MVDIDVRVGNGYDSIIGSKAWFGIIFTGWSFSFFFLLGLALIFAASFYAGLPINIFCLFA